jgi:hypothetical protein
LGWLRTIIVSLSEDQSVASDKYQSAERGPHTPGIFRVHNVNYEAFDVDEGSTGYVRELFARYHHPRSVKWYEHRYDGLGQCDMARRFLWRSREEVP